MEKKRVIRDVTGLQEMFFHDFGPRAYSAVDQAAVNGTDTVVLSHLYPFSFCSCMGFDERYLSVSALQEEGLIHKKIIPYGKNHALLMEAYENYGFTYEFAAFCFLDWVRMDATAQLFADTEHTTDWKKWRDVLQKFPSEGGYDVKSHEKEILENCFARFILDQQWKKLHRYARVKKLSLIGRIPFCAGISSCEGWWNQGLFHGNKYDWNRLMEQPSLFTDRILTAAVNYDGILLEDAGDILNHRTEFRILQEIIRKNSPSLILYSQDRQVMNFLMEVQS